MKVWGVRNFYSHLERVSEEGSRFSSSYFVLVATSSLLATVGLLANNVVVIIGSMCVAPFLGPARAVSVGATYQKWRIVGKGLTKQILGLLAIGSTIAFVSTVVFQRLLPEIHVTPEILTRTLPTLTSVHLAMVVAFASGVVASFALIGSLKHVAKPYQERPRARHIYYPRLFDATIGVEIGISLIPPAAVAGIGLAFGRVELLLHAIALLLINVWGLNVGSILTLSLWGVEPRPLELERRLRRIAEETITTVVNADEVVIGVVLHSERRADVYVRLYTSGILDHTDRLSTAISKRLEDVGVSNTVRIIVYSVQAAASSQVEAPSSLVEIQVP
jgi:uncharacterized membrane protein